MLGCYHCYATASPIHRPVIDPILFDMLSALQRTPQNVTSLSHFMWQIPCRCCYRVF